MTKLYVMWFHLDTAGYGFRHAGVATSPNATGPFRFVHGIQPDGFGSLDMSLFRDPLDQQAYFVRSCDNAFVGISRLTDDYLNSKGMPLSWTPIPTIHHRLLRSCCAPTLSPHVARTGCSRVRERVCIIVKCNVYTEFNSDQITCRPVGRLGDWIAKTRPQLFSSPPP